MSIRTRLNKATNFTRKAKAIARVGNYYQLSKNTSVNGVEYNNITKAHKQVPFRLPKLGLNTVFNYLLKDIKGRTELMTYASIQQKIAELSTNKINNELDELQKEGGDA